ncbi:MAG: hypothetical protein WCA80_00960 [Candidatus Aquilonibacter sp.]
MNQTTLYLAKLLGLVLLALGVSMLVQGQNTIDVWIGLVHSAPLVYVVGVATVAAGFAIVLAHNIWRGALAITVTVLGWLTLVKGITALVLRADLAIGTFTALAYDRFYYVYSGIWLLLGAYLTIAGFRYQKS